MSSRGGWVAGLVSALIGTVAPMAAAQSCQTDAECNDGLLCTLDQCLFNTCSNTHRDSLCDDGSFCNGQETCDAATDSCQPGTPVTCDPGLYCSDRARRCVQCDFDADCEDVCCCTGTVSCPQGGGLCFCGGALCGTELPCIDENPCTRDICVDGECPAPPSYNVATECCDPDTGGIVPLSDGDDCTDDVCDTETGEVSHPPASCDDGDGCTVDDVCDEFGVCLGVHVSNLPCSYDSDCPVGYCHTTTGFCACTSCTSSAHCNDGLACTTDSCNTAAGVCRFEPDDAVCETGGFCLVHACDRELGCSPANLCTPQLGNPCPVPGGCIDDLQTCSGCRAPIVTAAGSRYLDIEAGAQGTTPVAFLVTGDCTDANASCLSMYVDFDDPNNTDGSGVAHLVASPVYRRRAQWGSVHLRDVLIVPSATYRVYQECNFANPPTLSVSVQVRTWRWADTNDQGDAPVDFTDISRVVDGFTGEFGGGTPPLTFEMVDIAGNPGEGFCTPNRDISFLDISSAVDAFTGTMPNCADPCP